VPHGGGRSLSDSVIGVCDSWTSFHFFEGLVDAVIGIRDLMLLKAPAITSVPTGVSVDCPRGTRRCHSRLRHNRLQVFAVPCHRSPLRCRPFYCSDLSLNHRIT